MKRKYDPTKLFLQKYNYDAWFKNEELIDKEESSDKEESTDLPPMPSLEGHEEEAKEGKGLKILTLNKLLTILPILSAQIKTGKNSYKLKNKIRQILYLPYHHNKINKKVYNNFIKSYNNEKKYDCDKRSQNFLFSFWLA